MRFLIEGRLINLDILSGYLVPGSGVVNFQHMAPNLFVLDEELATIDGIAVDKFPEVAGRRLSS